MTPDLTRNLVQRWWDAIDRADFHEAASLLADDAVVDWPLSNERMASPEAWRQVNIAYPGQWRAAVISMVVEGAHAMTVTRVFDPSIDVLAISHFTVENGRITELVEYWPEAYAAPEWRAALITPLHADRLTELDTVS